MNKNTVEYEYEEILNTQSGTQYLFDVPVPKGHHRKAACRCGYCNKIKIMEIRDAKKGRCCSRECAGKIASKKKEKYHNGDIINEIGSQLIRRLDSTYGIIKCGKCGQEYRGNISQVANRNMVCFTCRGEASAEHRTIYKVGEVFINKHGNSFLFKEELDPTYDSCGHPRRVGIFIAMDNNTNLKEPFTARLDFVVNGHITGKNFSGGARKIANILTAMNIPYEREYTFDDLKSIDTKYPLRFDFMIPLSDRIVLLEFDGEQHYRPISFFGGQESFEKLRRNDKIKDDYVKRLPSTFLYRIPYYEESKIDSYYIYNLLFERG